MSILWRLKDWWRRLWIKSCPICDLELIDERGTTLHCTERHYVLIEIPMQGGGLCKIERGYEDAEEYLQVMDGHFECDHGIVAIT